jgi:hypothetical protein
MSAGFTSKKETGFINSIYPAQSSELFKFVRQVLEIFQYRVKNAVIISAGMGSKSPEGS